MNKLLFWLTVLLSKATDKTRLTKFGEHYQLSYKGTKYFLRLLEPEDLSKSFIKKHFAEHSTHMITSVDCEHLPGVCKYYKELTNSFLVIGAPNGTFTLLSHGYRSGFQKIDHVEQNFHLHMKRVYKSTNKFYLLEKMGAG